MADTHVKLTWHNSGDNVFEAGVRDVALYLKDSSKAVTADTQYGQGVAWNGVTAISESPSGADVSDFYADDVKYASLRATETFGFSIEGYTYPDEWMQCDGSMQPMTGVTFGQQTRKYFGIAFKTSIGDDNTADMDTNFKLHLIYNATASPSERGYQTINESPDAITFSWECSSNAVKVYTDGILNATAKAAALNSKPVSCITIDSREFDTEALKAKLDALLDYVYGKEDSSGSTGGQTPYLPAPHKVLNILYPAE